MAGQGSTGRQALLEHTETAHDYALRTLAFARGDGSRVRRRRPIKKTVLLSTDLPGHVDDGAYDPSVSGQTLRHVHREVVIRTVRKTCTGVPSYNDTE